MRRLVGGVCLLLLAACGEQTAPPGAGDGATEGAATPRGIAAVVIDHVALDANRSRGEYSRYGYPATVSADVDYGVDPEGAESGETLTVVARISKLEDVLERDRYWLRCRPKERPRGGCEEEQIDGGTLIYSWGAGQPEEDPGSVSYTYVRDGVIVRAGLTGPMIEESDPRQGDLGIDLGDLREIALDPRLTFTMDDATLEAGRELSDYRGDEQPPEKPNASATPPEALASIVVRYTGIQPTLARPSVLDDFGPDAVGAHLEFPATRRWAAATVDILTVADRPPMMDPMPCGDTNTGDPQPPGATCFGWTEDNVVTWQKATKGQPAKIWILGYHYNETYRREESVGILITTPDLTFDLFTEEYHDVPEWWLGGLGPLPSALNVGPEMEFPDDYTRVPTWQD